MSVWRRNDSTPDHDQSAIPASERANPEGGPNGDGAPHVKGERGLPPAKAFQSLQSRVSSVLTVGLMTVLAAGLLIYYYTSALSRGSKAREAAQVQQQRRAQGESTLPPLATDRRPRVLPAVMAQELTTADPARATEAPKSAYPAAPTSPIDQILGTSPPPLAQGTAPENQWATSNPYVGPNGESTRPKTPAQLALDRRLSGPVLTRTAEQSSSTAPVGAVEEGGPTAYSSAPPSARPVSDASREASQRGDTLDSLLRETPTPAVNARVLPTQRFLLPKGAFIDCTLETAINSSLPGITTCITATDTYSADGSVVLLERGTKLSGETRGAVQAGSPRLFVLWDEARTPAGIVVPLASPGTDELGRSGLSGSIDWHWWQRFGSALLISVIDGAIQAATQRSDSATVQLNPSGASDVIANILRSDMDVAPTVNKPQGDRIQILVARDVDFRSVYVLRDRTIGGHP